MAVVSPAVPKGSPCRVRAKGLECGLTAFAPVPIALANPSFDKGCAGLSSFRPVIRHPPLPALRPRRRHTRSCPQSRPRATPRPLLDLRSKLATARSPCSETLTHTPDEEPGIKDTDEDEFYHVVDWLLRCQPRIERHLAGRHLQDGALVLPPPRRLPTVPRGPVAYTREQRACPKLEPEVIRPIDRDDTNRDGSPLYRMIPGHACGSK